MRRNCAVLKRTVRPTTLALAGLLMAGSAGAPAAWADAPGMSPEVVKKLNDSFRAISEDRDDEAERILLEILSSDSNDPVALNNLAFVRGFGLSEGRTCPDIIKILRRAREHADSLQVSCNVHVKAVGHCGFIYAYQPSPGPQDQSKQTQETCMLSKALDRNIQQLEDGLKRLQGQ